jgi:dihydrofolate synthase/folylpolyglutamate synthase
LLDRLFALETFGIKLGLENIGRLCDALDHPERAFACLHVAGTNGKGSVAAMTHAALVAAGIKAARYTSPHLVDVTERFVIDREPVAMSVLEAAAERVLACAARLEASGDLLAPPTFFEATTATAFEMFRDAGVQVAVIEVGLGGRFDATNVITPVAGAITTIGLDHQQHLGKTLAQIAFEKAGIIKPGVPVVIGDLPDEARDVVYRTAQERGSQVVEAVRGADIKSDMVDGAARITIRTPRGEYGPVQLGLSGEHQVANALIAVRLLECAGPAGINVSRDAIVRGLSQPDWPARLELFHLPGGRRVLLDAAHNIDGATALVKHLRAWYGRPLLVLGVMHDKDVDAILRILLPAVSGVVATAAPSPRATPATDLARRAAAVAESLSLTGPEGAPLAVSTIADANEAVAHAIAQSDLVCVAGSVFLAGAVRDGLRARAILR